MSRISGRVLKPEDAGQIVGRDFKALVWGQPDGRRGWIVPRRRPDDDRWGSLPVDQEGKLVAPTMEPLVPVNKNRLKTDTPVEHEASDAERRHHKDKRDI